MSDLKIGDMVVVSDIPGYFPQWDEPRELLGMTTMGSFLVMSTSGEDIALPYKYAKKVVEKVFQPYTIDTFPKGEVWIRELLGGDGMLLVLGVSGSGVSDVRGSLPYHHLLDYYELSADGGHNWHKAGVEVEV